MSTKVFQAAKVRKNDEHYTLLEDVERELNHYKENFEGKIIFCNCDDPYESAFFKYFALKFNSLKLKKLIATSYKPSVVVGNELDPKTLAGLSAHKSFEPFAIRISEVTDLNADGAVDLADVELLLTQEKNTSTLLCGDESHPAGDFRSKESVDLLQEADIVITNPPFSLHREYLSLLMENEKKFIIVGDENWMTKKDTFAHVMDDEMWFGYTKPKGFLQPDGTIKKFGDKCWYTNLPTTKRNEKIHLFKEYYGNEESYPKYANYDAIDVNKVANIPMDYEGEMGVPISFAAKYNPDQFEIVGSCRMLGKKMADCGHEEGTYVQGGIRFYLPNEDNTFRRLYGRIVIKAKGEQSED